MGTLKDLVPWGYAPSTWMQNMWLKYKLTREGWVKLWERQSGVCAGCEEKLAHPFIRDMNKEGLKPQIDHRHRRVNGVEQQCVTEDVRGLLCGECNRFLGLIQDNRQLMKNLTSYLEQHGDY